MQTCILNMTMKTHAHKKTKKLRDENPITKLQCQLAINNLLVVHIFEYMKLTNLIIIQVVGSVKDERTLSTLAFMKSKLWNQLTRHLNIVVCMFKSSFFH
jgi:hypothetical protein